MILASTKRASELGSASSKALTETWSLVHGKEDLNFKVTI
jgi:hypothetical protein